MESYHQKTAIKFWAEEDRPREKLIAHGKQSLSNSELLAILIGSGTPKESALELSRRILGSVGNDLVRLSKLGLAELKQFKGIGEAKGVNILAGLELAKRRKESNTENEFTEALSTSFQAYTLLSEKLLDLPHEEFWIILLNRRNIPIKIACISKGGLAATIVDVRMILKIALENLASGIILAHNHPSGSPQPSDADKSLTKNIKESARLMDINILDHLIFGEKNYYSFCDEGLM